MKKTIIMLLLGIISFSKTNIQAQDTLSFEKAIQLSIKNENLNTENDDHLAKQEAQLISEVYCLYQQLSYYQEFEQSINDLEKLVIGKLEEKRKASDKNTFQLYSSMIQTEFQIQKANNQKLLIQSRTELYQKLHLKVTDVLRTNRQIIQSINSSNKAINPLDSMKFNNQVDYTQQLNLKTQLVRQIIIKELEEFDFKYKELLQIINKYFETQQKYYSNVIELENEYLKLLQPMFVGK